LIGEVEEEDGPDIVKIVGLSRRGIDEEVIDNHYQHEAEVHAIQEQLVAVLLGEGPRCPHQDGNGDGVPAFHPEVDGLLGSAREGERRDVVSVVEDPLREGLLLSGLVELVLARGIGRVDAEVVDRWVGNLQKPLLGRALVPQPHPNPVGGPRDSEIGGQVLGRQEGLAGRPSKDFVEGDGLLLVLENLYLGAR
jgi:hypothetical protein